MKNKDTFYENTNAKFCLANEELLKDINLSKPDYISYKNNNPNEISSKYWYTEMGVYRESDHWGEVASCIWTIEHKDEYQDYSGVCFAYWSGFKDNLSLDTIENGLFEYYLLDKKFYVLKSDEEALILDNKGRYCLNDTVICNPIKIKDRNIYKEFKIGQKVYHYLYGEGVVIGKTHKLKVIFKGTNYESFLKKFRKDKGLDFLSFTPYTLTDGGFSRDIKYIEYHIKEKELI